MQLWERIKASGIAPTFSGPQSDDPELRREFLVGARLYGLELVDLDDVDTIAELEAMVPPRFALQPQQLVMADALNGAEDEAVVEVPRRASKTTTILCWCLGRCHERVGYQVTFSAQSGVKASARLREWKTRLDLINPEDDADLPPWLRGRRHVNRRPVKPRQSKAQLRAEALFDLELPTPTAPEPDDDPEPEQRRGFRIMLGEVGKGIYFENSSTFLVLKPDADAYRGEAGDVSWLDEMQELDPEDGADLMAGLVPLQDTKHGGLIVCSGTAGELRVGPFWERVELIRKDEGLIGGVDWCAPEETPWELVTDEDAAIALLLTVHPGIGTLTTEHKMRKNWRKLEKPKFAREYFSMWPRAAGARLIPADAWADAVASRRPAIPTAPRGVAFGMSIKPGGAVAAIAAAWRNSRGQAYVEIVEHRIGTDWLPRRMAELTAKYRGSTVAFDDFGEGKATHTEAGMLDRPPKMRVQTYRETAAGCVQILRDLDRGTLRHFDDVELNAAVSRAGKREVKNDSGVWLWTPVPAGSDITCIDAATRALRNWDQHYSRRRTGAGNVMGGAAA